MIRLPRPSNLAAVIRSRFRPLDIGYDIVREALGNYNLSIIGKPTNLAYSRRTGNVTVQTTAGRMVLKRYRNHLQAEGIRYIHSILTRLFETDYPATRLFHTPAGADFISLKTGRYAVFEYVPGSNYSLDFLLPADRRKLFEISGKILASFHKSLLGFKPLGAHHLGFVSETGGWQRDSEWFAAKMNELVERSRAISNISDRKNADFLVLHAQETFDEFSRLDEKLLKSNLFRTIIHGDFGLHNIIFTRDGTGVLTDFETTRLEWRLADLVSTLSRNRSANTMYNFNLINRFLVGYQSIFPAGKMEWRFLPDVWRFIKLRSVFIGWNSYFERGGDRLLSAIDAYNQAEWAKENVLTLSKLGDL